MAVLRQTNSNSARGSSSPNSAALAPPPPSTGASATASSCTTTASGHVSRCGIASALGAAATALSPSLGPRYRVETIALLLVIIIVLLSSVASGGGSRGDGVVGPRVASAIPADKPADLARVAAAGTAGEAEGDVVVVRARTAAVKEDPCIAHVVTVRRLLAPAEPRYLVVGALEERNRNEAVPLDPSLASRLLHVIGSLGVASSSGTRAYLDRDDVLWTYVESAAFEDVTSSTAEGAGVGLVALALFEGDWAAKAVADVTCETRLVHHSQQSVDGRVDLPSALPTHHYVLRPSPEEPESLAHDLQRVVPPRTLVTEDHTDGTLNRGAVKTKESVAARANFDASFIGRAIIADAVPSFATQMHLAASTGRARVLSLVTFRSEITAAGSAALRAAARDPARQVLEHRRPDKGRSINHADDAAAVPTTTVPASNIDALGLDWTPFTAASADFVIIHVSARVFAAAGTKLDALIRRRAVQTAIESVISAAASAADDVKHVVVTYGTTSGAPGANSGYQPVIAMHDRDLPSQIGSFTIVQLGPAFRKLRESHMPAGAVKGSSVFAHLLDLRTAVGKLAEGSPVAVTAVQQYLMEVAHGVVFLDLQSSEAPSGGPLQAAYADDQVLVANSRRCASAPQQERGGLATRVRLLLLRGALDGVATAGAGAGTVGQWNCKANDYSSDVVG